MESGDPTIAVSDGKLPAAFPPRHVCIAGSLFIAAGVSSAVGVVASAIDGRFSLDFGFVFIFIGYGILLGKSTSRGWGRFFTAAALLVFLAVAAIWLHGHFTGNQMLKPEPELLAIIGYFGALGVTAYMFFVLWGKKHMDWFVSNEMDRGSVRSLALVAAVLSGLLASSQALIELDFKQKEAQIFPVDVTVIPYNSETGEGARSLSYDYEKGDLYGEQSGSLNRLTFGMGSGEDGLELSIHGVAVKPQEVVVLVDGLKPTPVRISRDTESEIRLPMKPLTKQTPGHQGGR